MIDMTTGPIWALWHGGANYSHGDRSHIERFATVEDAAIEAWNRLKCGGHFACEFDYVNQPATRALTPCVDEDSTMELYLSDPTDEELIPDAVLEYDAETSDFRIADDGDFVTRPPRS